MKSKAGACVDAGRGTGAGLKNMLPTPAVGAGRSEGAAGAWSGSGGGAAFTGFGGALGFQPGGMSPTPGSISGRVATEAADAAGEARS